MAVVYSGTSGLNIPEIWIGSLQDLLLTTTSPTFAAGYDSVLPLYTYEFYGTGFTYSPYGPIGGTLNRIVEKYSEGMTFDIRGMAIDIPVFVYWVENDLNFEAITTILEGNDQIFGSDVTDALAGWDGNDEIHGYGGDDALGGSLGNDYIDGGSGNDFAVYVGYEWDYHIVHNGGTTLVVPKNPQCLAWLDGIDTLINIENLYFAEEESYFGPAVPLSAAIDEYFNPLDYIASYGDLSDAFGANPEAGWNHFLYSGVYEGRMTSFDGLEYIASNGDLMNAFGANSDSGSAHYINTGRFEGRSTSFNGLEYIASYGDLMNAFGANSDSGSAHYINTGRFEGRTMTFDGLDYIASYSDLMSAFGANANAGAAHYISTGRFEGRTATFDGLEYIASYSDLIAAFGPNGEAGRAHYYSNGFAEGRSVSFDGLQYIASYGDLIQAFRADGGAGSAHYITNGLAEGRAIDTFDEVAYLNKYADLQAAFGPTNYEAATIHYITYGYDEGRTDNLT